MATAHHVIYVPGLGDARSFGQDTVIAMWRRFGLTTHYLPIGWADKEDFRPKLARLLAKIDELKKQGHAVSLVGVSAGASAVLNAYAQHPDLNAVVCICGKINNPQTIGGTIFKINPAFRQSVYQVKASLEKLGPVRASRIMSIHPLADGTVPVADTKIPGAVEKTVPVIGHRLGIFYSLIFATRTVANFIKDPRRR